MLTPGQSIGNYVVEAEIGRGGMARLYRIRHAVLGTRHALKVLEASYRVRPEVRARFLGEAMIAANLSHPNIVRVTDTISTDDVAGLVMELVAGPNLEDYIRGLRTPAAADLIREIFLPILDAVGAAHRQGIIHRDLKPANILLELRDSGIVPKVTDFGIAKVSDTASAVLGKKASTHLDAKMGTLAYMSPEQIRRAKEVTARSDIFSLGATLYELATGRTAFEGDSDYDIMDRIVKGRAGDPAHLAGVDAAIAAAIRRALQPDPADRFPSCEDFAQALALPGAFEVQAPELLPEDDDAQSEPTHPGRGLQVLPPVEPELERVGAQPRNKSARVRRDLSLFLRAVLFAAAGVVLLVIGLSLARQPSRGASPAPAPETPSVSPATPTPPTPAEPAPSRPAPPVVTQLPGGERVLNAASQAWDKSPDEIAAMHSAANLRCTVARAEDLVTCNGCLGLDLAGCDTTIFYGNPCVSVGYAFKAPASYASLKADVAVLVGGHCLGPTPRNDDERNQLAGYFASEACLGTVRRGGRNISFRLTRPTREPGNAVIALSIAAPAATP